MAEVGVFLFIFALIGWWSFFRPQSAFLLLLILMPVLPMLKSTQVVPTFTLVKDVIILALFVTLVLVPLWQKKLPYRRNMIMAPLVALLLWLVVNFWRADSLLLGVLRVREAVLYMLLFFAVLYLPHAWRYQRERLVWFLAVVGATLLLGGYQWFFAADSAVLRFDPVTREWIPRISSVLAHPSIFGQWLTAASTLLLPLVFLVKQWRWRVIFGIVLAVSVVAIFLTYSRGVWLGFAASVGTTAFAVIFPRVLSRSKAGLGEPIRVFGVVVVVGFLIALLNFTPARGLIFSIVDPTYGSNEERIEFMARLVTSLDSFEVVVGKGLGNVTAQQLREVELSPGQLAGGDAEAVQMAKNQTLVDNQYLKTLVEMGVVGLVLYGWLYWRVAVGAYVLAMSHDRRLQVVGLWAMGFLAAFVVQALFIDIWDIWPTNALFWIVAALVSVYQNPRLSLRQVSVAQRRQ